MLWRGVRDGSAASAPPSASLPAGLPGRRIRSLIHASLVVILTRKMAGSHICEPLAPGRTLVFFRVVGAFAVGYFAEIESVASVWRARKPRREERQHGKCGDWRTLLSYPALRPNASSKAAFPLRCNPLVTGYCYSWSLGDGRYPPFARASPLQVPHRPPAAQSEAGKRSCERPTADGDPHFLNICLAIKNTFAGRSASRRMKYGYHSVPNGIYTLSP